MWKYDILNVIEPMKALQNTSSRLEKEEILKQNADNELFKETLKYMLDNLRVSGISTKKINKDVQICYVEEDAFDWCLDDLLHYFDTHSTGSDNDVAYVKFFAGKIAETHLDMYDDILQFVYDVVTKSIRTGVDVTTVNKIYGKDFIKKLEIMLGTSIEHCNIPEGTYFYISQKLNGTRCFYYKGKLYTRQGKEYTGLEHIIKDIQTLCTDYGYDVNDLVFDGELLLKDLSAGDSESFQISTGIANSKQDDKSMLRLVLFDVIPTCEFKDGISKLTYKERKTFLNQCREDIADKGLENLSVVDMFYEGTDQKKIWEWLDYAERTDMEGVMLNLDTPYECKRTKNLIKVKRFYTMDLLVVNVEAGTGRNKNRMGKVQVEYKNNLVGVGSGFSDEQRNYYWEHPEEIIGKIIEVKYKESTRNKDGSESLQFPVFMGIREDKDEVSYE